jgi:hypothetical protein
VASSTLVAATTRNASSPVADDRIEKWTRWMEGTTESNVLTMHLQRDTWREVSKLLEDNGQLPKSYWCEFMRDTYGHTQAVAVRRQADTHKGVASLGRLIVEIRDDPSPVTREFWLGLWGDLSDPIDRHFAERTWADQYGGRHAHSSPSPGAFSLNGAIRYLASSSRRVTASRGVR